MKKSILIAMFVIVFAFAGCGGEDVEIECKGTLISRPDGTHICIPTGNQQIADAGSQDGGSGQDAGQDVGRIPTVGESTNGESVGIYIKIQAEREILDLRSDLIDLKEGSIGWKEELVNPPSPVIEVKDRVVLQGIHRLNGKLSDGGYLCENHGGTAVARGKITVLRVYDQKGNAIDLDTEWYSHCVIDGNAANIIFLVSVAPPEGGGGLEPLK